MGFYDFPHTRYYDEELGFIVREIKKLKDDIKKLQTEMIEVQNNISLIKKDIANIKLDITNIQKDIANIQQKLLEIVNNYKQLVAKITTLESKVDINSTDIKHIKDDITNINVHISEIQGNIDILNEFMNNIPLATAVKTGGIKALPKTTRDNTEVKIDSTSGKLYVNTTLSQAGEWFLGGVKARPKALEDTTEVKIDTDTGFLYVNAKGGGGGSILSNTSTDNLILNPIGANYFEFRYLHDYSTLLKLSQEADFWFGRYSEQTSSVTISTNWFLEEGSASDFDFEVSRRFDNPRDNDKSLSIVFTPLIMPLTSNPYNKTTPLTISFEYGKSSYGGTFEAGVGLISKQGILSEETSKIIDSEGTKFQLKANLPYNKELTPVFFFRIPTKADGIGVKNLSVVIGETPLNITSQFATPHDLFNRYINKGALSVIPLPSLAKVLKDKKVIIPIYNCINIDDSKIYTNQEIYLETPRGAYPQLSTNNQLKQEVYGGIANNEHYSPYAKNLTLKLDQLGFDNVEEGDIVRFFSAPSFLDKVGTPAYLISQSKKYTIGE